MPRKKLNPIEVEAVNTGKLVDPNGSCRVFYHDHIVGMDVDRIFSHSLHGNEYKQIAESLCKIKKEFNPKIECK